MACALDLQFVTHDICLSRIVWKCHMSECLLFTLKFSTYFCPYKAVYEFVFDIQD